jgi:hypothetical protein
VIVKILYAGEVVIASMALLRFAELSLIDCFRVLVSVLLSFFEQLQKRVLIRAVAKKNLIGVFIVCVLSSEV